MGNKEQKTNLKCLLNTGPWFYFNISSARGSGVQLIWLNTRFICSRFNCSPKLQMSKTFSFFFPSFGWCSTFEDGTRLWDRAQSPCNTTQCYVCASYRESLLAKLRSRNPRCKLQRPQPSAKKSVGWESHYWRCYKSLPSARVFLGMSSMCVNKCFWFGNAIRRRVIRGLKLAARPLRQGLNPGFASTKTFRRKYSIWLEASAEIRSWWTFLPRCDITVHSPRALDTASSISERRVDCAFEICPALSAVN